MEENRNFSILERYGENFTKNEYITNPAIGRDNEIKELLLILLTPEKSAILIGKPGVGKTAVVEGLAYRIKNNDVPDLLKGYTIINIKTASLLGTVPSGESKVQLMIDELKEKEKIILFIDEIHMLIGATDSSSLDFANIFKEGLGRGSIKVIGATTTQEYEHYILRDKAFTRRFQKIMVEEPNRDETVAIMMGTLPKIEKNTGLKLKYTNFIKENIMGFLVDFTSEYKRVFEIGSRYPDISLTLLKQAFSYAIYDNLKEVNIFHIQKAIENTKNVYPDVIKKEVPKFLQLFKDIIEEEKGISISWDYSEKKQDNNVPISENDNINTYTFKQDVSGKSLPGNINNDNFDDFKVNESSFKNYNSESFKVISAIPRHDNSASLDSKLINNNINNGENGEINMIESLLNVKPVPISEDEYDKKTSRKSAPNIDLNLNDNVDDLDNDYFD